MSLHVTSKIMSFLVINSGILAFLFSKEHIYIYIYIYISCRPI